MGDCRSIGGTPRRGMGRFFKLPAVAELLAEEGFVEVEVEMLHELLDTEWLHFDVVNGIAGRAECQDNAIGFFIYRTAQYLSFPRETLACVHDDVLAADAAGRNVIREKYARMMERTDPAEFDRTWRGRLEEISTVKQGVLDSIEQALRAMLEDASCAMPASTKHARGTISRAELISSIDYYICEISSYSLNTLYCLRDGLQQQLANHVNPIADTYVNSLRVQQALEA